MVVPVVCVVVLCGCMALIACKRSISAMWARGSARLQALKNLHRVVALIEVALGVSVVLLLLLLLPNDLGERHIRGASGKRLVLNLLAEVGVNLTERGGPIPILIARRVV